MVLQQHLELSFPIDVPTQGVHSFAAHFFPASARHNGVLQVLIHGNSYDHSYWNAPVINGQNYSYTKYMTDRGFDILAVDLPGVGNSDRPDGHSVSLESVGRAMSNMVSTLRENSPIPGREYTHISIVGHSMGASISVYTEARWPTADSLVLTATGFCTSRPRSAWAPGAREALLGVPYALVSPEGRIKFYHQESADPQVIEFDNATLRTSIPSGIWSDCISLQDDRDAGFAKITCPVFIQLGEYDPILPSACADAEASLYASSSEVQTQALKDMGHSFNLHRNREEGWSGIASYLNQFT